MVTIIVHTDIRDEIPSFEQIYSMDRHGAYTWAKAQAPFYNWVVPPYRSSGAQVYRNLLSGEIHRQAYTRIEEAKNALAAFNARRAAERLDEPREGIQQISPHMYQISMDYQKLTIALVGHSFHVETGCRFCLWLIYQGREPERFEPDDPIYTPKNLVSVLHASNWEYDPDSIIVEFSDIATPIEQHFALRLGPKNCVISLIRDYMQTNKKKYNEKNLVDLEAKVAETGFTSDHADFVLNKLRLRLRIYSDAGIWYDSDPEDMQHRPILMIYARENHATKFEGFGKISHVIYVSRNSINTYIHEHHKATKIITQCEQLHLDGEDTKRIVFTSMAQQDDTIIKIYQPPSPDDQNDAYYYCSNELSYCLKKWVEKHDLHPSPYGSPYGALLVRANHYINHIAFMPEKVIKQYDGSNKSKCYAYDLNKAYPSFYLAPEYKTYGLPIGGERIFTVSDQDKAIDLLATVTGWVVLDKVICRNPIVLKLNLVGDGYIVPIPLVYYLHSIDAIIFKITHIITAIKSLELHDFLRDITDRKNKQFNNQFIGRLISDTGSKHNVKEQYIAYTQSDSDEILYQCSRDPHYLDGRSDFTQEGDIEVYHITATYEKEESSIIKGYYGIHSYILAYKEITLLKALIKIPIADIIAVHVDCIYTTKSQNIEPSEEPGGFKLAVGDAIKTVGYCTNISNRSVIDILPGNLPDLALFEQRLGQFTLTMGPAGAGKSRDYLAHPDPSSIFLTPTHQLKYNHRNDPDHGFKGQMSTYQKFFRIGTRPCDQEIYSNVILDECTMLDKKTFETCKAICLKYHMNFHVLGDFLYPGTECMEPAQLYPYDGDPLDSTSFEGFQLYTCSSMMRRQQDDECVFLDALRGLNQELQIELMKLYLTEIGLSDHLITPDQIAGLYEHGDHGIVSNHRRGSEFSAMVIKAKNEIKVRVVKPNKMKKLVPKGADVNNVFPRGFEMYLPPERANEVLFRINATERTAHTFECAYFNAIDAVQGATYKTNLFVDTQAHRRHVFYTAITRLSSLKNLYLII